MRLEERTMNPGIDFYSKPNGFGVANHAAKAIWMLLPMGLMLIGATVGGLVTTWLGMKISANSSESFRLHGPFWVAQQMVFKLLGLQRDVVPAKSDAVLSTNYRWDSGISAVFNCAVWMNLVIIDVSSRGSFCGISASITPIGLLMAGCIHSQVCPQVGWFEAAAQSIMRFL